MSGQRSEPEAFITTSVLRWARWRQRWPIKRAAQILGVKATELASWEAGELRMTWTQARRCTEVYEIPFGYLWLSVPPRDWYWDRYTVLYRVAFWLSRLFYGVRRRAVDNDNR